MDEQHAKIAIVGAGLIGRAWAIVFARAGHPVTVYDGEATVLAAAPDLIRRSLEDLQACGLLADASEIARRIRPAAELRDALAGAAHVQESIFEDVDAKRAIFAQLDALAPENCVLASSSSYIPASRFTEGLAGRARTLIAHPANPPHVIPIVELVPAPWTAGAAVARTHALFASAGQVPIVVQREIDGFILNRLQAALLNEALRLVEDGYVTTGDLDKTVSAGLGRRWAFMGPFETIDLNAAGGIADYARRYAPSLYELARQQADPRYWTQALVGRIESERRSSLPMEGHRARQEWRDRCLMLLSKALDPRKDP